MTVGLEWKAGSQVHTNRCEGMCTEKCPLSGFLQAIVFCGGNVDEAFDFLRPDELQHIVFSTMDIVPNLLIQLPMWPLTPKALPKSTSKPRNALSVMCNKHPHSRLGPTCGFVLFQANTVKS